MDDEITILVANTAPVRGSKEHLYRRITINSKTFEENISLFLINMGDVIEKTPEKVGGFRLAEITIKAEVTAEGKLVLCGVGGEIGITGGLEFTLKRE